MLDEDVVELPDEKSRKVILVGLLRDDGCPRAIEFRHEVDERRDERLAEQSCLRAEMAEKQMFRDAGGIGDLTSRGAAVILPGE